MQGATLAVDSVDSFTNVLAYLGGITTTGIAVAWKLAPKIRRFSHFLDDVIGEEARPGVPAKPGLVARVASIEEDVSDLKTGQDVRAHVQEEQAELLSRLGAAVEQITAWMEGQRRPPQPPGQRAVS